MTISDIGSSGSITAMEKYREEKPANTLQDNFFTMLIAQLRNQDPTNPMDNNQLTGQLTQFQMVSGIETIGRNVAVATDTVKDMQKANMTNWISKKVLIAGSARVTMGKNNLPNISSQTLDFSLSHNAMDVDVILTNAQGHTFIGKLKDAKAGLNRYSLDEIKNIKSNDSMQDENTPWELDNAVYRVSYSAVTATGDRPDIKSLKSATIEGVSFSNDGALLQLGENGSAQLKDIYFIE